MVEFLFHLVSLKMQSIDGNEYLEAIKPLDTAMLYQLINGANFFDIELILDSFISIFASRILDKNCSFILKEFNNENCSLPYELIRKILFSFVNYHFFKKLDSPSVLLKPSFFVFDFEFDYIYKVNI